LTVPDLPAALIDHALAWCAGVLGPVRVMADASKTHGGHVSATQRLHTAAGFCYLKVHDSAAHWHNEVHAYEQWAAAFGDHAPRLIAVRDEAPLALIVSEIPGQILEHVTLPRDQEQAVWRAAGAALARLHDRGPGAAFGPVRRDGSPADDHPVEAPAYLRRSLNRDIDRAVEGDYLTPDELATLRAACDRIPAFAGERPTPCHRDYCAANWLVSPAGTWAGVIDFEFAYWDVRVNDFSRDPDWHWMHRPDLLAAFFAGYGRPLTADETRQIIVTRAAYALSAIVWGRDNAFYGFEREGRAALAHLAGLLD
jgi:Ser/Thr protein kinase RdoA (MazF antagonist)